MCACGLMCCDGGWQAWSVNRYAMVARKHGLYHTSINIINQMYGFNAMEVQEAFTKIKEQVPCNAPPPFTSVTESSSHPAPRI